MFSLTESTLFFLDLALTGRTVKKFVQGGPVKTWVTDVAAAETNNPAFPAPSTKTSLTMLPSSYKNCSESTAPNTPVALSDLPVDESNEIFADAVDDRAEKLATMKCAMALGTQMVTVSAQWSQASWLTHLY